MVRIMDNIIPVTIGKIKNTLSFFRTISPGRLNNDIFGNNRKMQPSTRKIKPRMMKDLARLCTKCGRINPLVFWVCLQVNRVLHQVL